MSAYQAIHEEMHCETCKFSDPKQINKGACCTHMHGPLPSEDGLCLRHREASKPAPAEKGK